ncbi:hypothetical protein KUCAC02_033427 [Chaenocephalus aceratus]|nr:hypothetical protein KUCAC02_033427 [Chaenocephalus aceratus]
MLGPFRILNIEGKRHCPPHPPPQQSARHEEHPLMERLGGDERRCGPSMAHTQYTVNLLVLAPGEELEGEIVNAYLAWVGAKAGVFIGLLPDDFPLEGNPQGSLRKLDLSKHEVAAGAIAGLETQAFSWETGLHDNRSSQTDGVYVLLVLKLAEQIQQVQYPVDQEGVASKRFHMAKALVNSSDDLSELCRACGEHSIGPKVDQWYPEGSTKKEQYVMTRRADSFRMKDGELYYLCRRKQNKAEHLAKVVTEPLELVGMDLVGTLTGSELCNKVNSGLCERLDIKRSLCSAYHPQTNGLVEKLNGTIQRSLNKMVAGHPKRWDQIECTTCNMWHHIGCVGLPSPTEEQYVCPSCTS